MNAHLSWIGVKPAPNPCVTASFTASVSMPLAYFGYFRPLGPNSIRAIAQRVANQYGISLDELRGPGRSRRVAWPRQEAMYLMRQVMRNGYPRYSLPLIGAFFGDRDHTTVLHAVRAVEKRMIGVEAA
jgi:hypothetical protein